MSENTKDVPPLEEGPVDLDHLPEPYVNAVDEGSDEVFVVDNQSPEPDFDGEVG